MSTARLFNKRFRTKAKKVIAVYLAFVMIFDMAWPTCSFALTGGPSQPEVQSFEPVGTSDMVDLFSGDFNYNIPLLDVGGYPINISYHSGVTTDQEASWVGLGWNINPGVVNRSMRGIPDDFNGDPVTKSFNIKDNRTMGLNAGFGLELFGLDNFGLGLNYSLGVHYNNYVGFGLSQSVNLSLSAGDPDKGPISGSGSLGISSSSQDGLSLQSSNGLNYKQSEANNSSTNLGFSLGASFNSRAGLKVLTVGTKMGSPGKGIGDLAVSENGVAATATFNLGMPTYTPELSMPMKNLSITANFKLGGSVYGLFPNYTIGGFYSSQSLAAHTVTARAYGYLNEDIGVHDDGAMLDFNRQGDGTFTQNTPDLPVTNFTYDIYSVSGQGTSGSYRPFRGDLGQVYDPVVRSTSDGFSIGGEFGLGATFHDGIDVTVNNVNTQSGRWKDDNPAATALSYRSSVPGNPLYEKYYFKEANEKSVDSDPFFLTSVGGDSAEAVYLTQVSKFNTIGDYYFTRNGNISKSGPIPLSGYRNSRDKRNNDISVLTRTELENNFGLDIEPNLYSGANGSHIAEVTSVKTDGTRYVYGIAAYNTYQEETTFAAGTTHDEGTITGVNYTTGLANYNQGSDNSIKNTLGLDNYYSSTVLPPYAHSYLLTAVLSPDYVDADNIPGPSTNDLGTYTRFKYSKISNYNWRVPFDSATYSEGLKAITNDDKASYLYGQKELWYLDTIETKNYIAVFTKEKRKDSFGVHDNNGGLDTNSYSELLRTITLYSAPDFKANGNNATPIKQVHFEYDYSLCSGVPNNSGVSETVNGVNINASKGKLTLKKIYFTYQGSQKGRFSPYEFTYNSYNPSYNIKDYDRWGYYKQNNVVSWAALDTGMSTAEYPYAEQNTNLANRNASAWSLTDIYLPSGGLMHVNYESDDYAYVQNKPANQMFKVIGVGDTTDIPTPSIDTISLPFSTHSSPGITKLIIKLPNPVSGGSSTELSNAFTSKYLAGLPYLYFRFLMEISPGQYDYVSGYVPASQIVSSGVYSSGSGDMYWGQYGWIELTNIQTDKTNSLSHYVSPMTLAAIQFGRLYLPKIVWGDNADLANGGFGEAFLNTLISSGFVKNIKDALEGPNEAIFDNGYCHNFVTDKSWIRLNNPNQHKLGGGARVSKITISDQWSGMTGTNEPTFDYGQQYFYTNKDGTSSGIASYEPQLGGDENPWRQPVFFDITKILAPNDHLYMEEPFGESFFPSPGVGYGRVTVKNLQRTNVTHHATGSVIHEFYTTKDFPTITRRTNIYPLREKSDVLGLSSLLHIGVKDYMTASQGYVVETNDMNGKPKCMGVYQQGQTSPISSVQYIYKSTPYETSSFQLDNSATVIQSDGTVSNANIGTFFDFTSDMREETTKTVAPSIQYNIDDFFVGVFPVPIPVILPAYSSEQTRFRSAVITKVVQHFGLLDQTIATDLGSVVSTKNLAYDAETGNVRLTQTTTNFNDSVFSLTYPAYWFYDGMGPAYQNIGFTINNVTITTPGTVPIQNAPSYFAQGDELGLTNYPGGSSVSSGKAWVTQVNATSINAVYENGSPLSGGPYNIKVVRSGRRNQQEMPMASLTTLTNPINSLTSNAYADVLQAGATEYSDEWKTYCNCFSSSNSQDDINYNSNPYIIGTQGSWRKKTSYLYLTDRTQSNYDGNTNIRKDGVFAAYTPFYNLVNGSWTMDKRNWTFTSQVTQYNPYGDEIEKVDALGRYETAVYGYNQSLATAVASNARFSDVGVDNFEDYGFSKCADDHFKIAPGSTYTLTQAESHTGRNSVMVNTSSTVNLTFSPIACTTSLCNLSYAIVGNSMAEIGQDGQTTYTAGTSDQIVISGGTSPYVFDWTTTNGSPNIQVFSNNSLFVKLSGQYSFNLTVTDQNNCKLSLVVSYSGGNTCTVQKLTVN